METFNFYLDQKVTTWMRTKFNVEAETLEEAKEKAILMNGSGELSGETWEEIDNVQEVMTVNDNQGCSTEELYYDNNHQLIYQNGE